MKSHLKRKIQFLFGELPNLLIRFGLALMCLFLGTCPDIRAEGLYLKTPFIHQEKNYCGPAALAMVMRHWDSSAPDQHQLAGRITPFPERGLSGAQMKELSALYEFDAYSFAGDQKFVREQLARGRPLIVALSGSLLSSTNHFVVLVGWDESSREWLVHDPADGPYVRMSEKALDRRWSKLKKWTLLIVPEPPQ